MSGPHTGQHNKPEAEARITNPPVPDERNSEVVTHLSIMAAMVRCVRQFSCARGPARVGIPDVCESTARYPPVLPSRTAKSRSAKRRRVTEFFDHLRGCSVKEKLTSLTKFERMKYVVYPQTFALNADRWYQHFTKTAFISGLPQKYSGSVQEAEGFDIAGNVSPTPMIQIDDVSLSEIRNLVCSSLLQDKCQVQKGHAHLHKQLQHTVAPFLKNLTSGMASVLVKQNLMLQSSTIGKVMC